MKTRLLPMFVVVAALALLAGFPQSGGATPQPREPEPPVVGTREDSCPPQESGEAEATRVPWKQSPDGHWFMPQGGDSLYTATTPATPQTTGGPDDFGYTWNDSVALSWIDATSGTDTGMSGDSYGRAVAVSLPFAFKYYENTYTSAYIAAAGYLAFSSASYWDDQENIPSPERPNNVIAPYWTPTYLNSTRPSARVYYRSGGSAPYRYFVVEWFDVKGGSPSDTIGGDDTYHFEVILHENGDIVFQYQTMVYLGDSWWCGTAGIEDSEGLDGLNYVRFCQKAPSNKAVRFYRPAPSARLGIRPLYQGRFASAGETATFQVPIRNTGDLGSDTFDLFTSSAWSVELYASDGVTPLTDTDGDETVDTGPVPQGGTVVVTARVTAPSYAVLGDSNAAAITARSSLDQYKSKTPTLQAAIPAFFAQVFRDNADGAMSLYLAQPGAQTVKKATADSYYGYYPAVAETPNGFAYFWTRYRSIGSGVHVREIEYTLHDRYGNPTRGVTKLADLSGATVRAYDYDPTVAVAPNGRIGVIWYRYLYNQSNGYWNYNIYYAILDASGNMLVPPTNLTNNSLWGFG